MDGRRRRRTPWEGLPHPVQGRIAQTPLGRERGGTVMVDLTAARMETPPRAREPGARVASAMWSGVG